MKNFTLLTSVFFFAAAADTLAGSTYNLDFVGKKTITAEENKYDVELFKYDPPYFHTKPYKTRQEADLSTPEGVDLALESSVGRDADWYWSLFDENAREFTQRVSKERGERFDDWDPGKPPVDDLRHQILYEEFLYKVEFESSGKQYAVIATQLVYEGKKENQQLKKFVKQGGSWFLTMDIDDHVIPKLALFYDYEAFLRAIEMEDPFELMFKTAEVKLESAKSVYRFGEPMVFTFSMKNVSEKPLSLYWSPELGKSCQIVFKQKEQTATFRFLPKVSVNPQEYKILDPGQEISSDYRIENYEKTAGGEISVRVSDDGQMDFQLPTGEFQVFALYGAPTEAINGPVAPVDLSTRPFSSKRIRVVLEDGQAPEAKP